MDAPPVPNVKVKQNGKFTTSEICEKLNILFGGGARILGYEYNYEADHYKQEASGLIRLMEKYPALAKAVILFDPLLIILGLIGKFKNLVKKKVETKPKDNAPANHPQTGQTVYAVTNR